MKYKLIISMFVFLILLFGGIYFNASSTNSLYADCNTGSGNAGDGGSNSYRVCSGEDFWLPEGVKESTYGKVGVWHEIPHPTNSNKHYLGDSNYFRFRWSLYGDQGGKYFYPQERLSADFDDGVAQGNYQCFNESHTSQKQRIEIYKFTQLHCMELCKKAVSEGKWNEATDGNCGIRYRDVASLPRRSEYEDLHNHFDLDVYDQLRSEFGSDTDFAAYDCGVRSINYDENLIDDGARNGQFWFNNNVVKYCNLDFKDSNYFKQNSLKLMISLGEGSVMNGELPRSCELQSFKDGLTSRFSAGNLEKALRGKKLLEYIASDPDWSNTRKVRRCVQEHYGNILESIDKFGIRDQIKSINFTHEGGNLWDFYKLSAQDAGRISQKDMWQANWISSVANAVDKYVYDDTSISSTDKSSRKLEWMNKFYVNFYHGRAFKYLIDSAITVGMGIGEHSLNTPHAYSYLQHLPHLFYNQKNMRYDTIDSGVPPIMHTDAEGLHKAHADLIGLSRNYLNTWGTFRIYRNAVLKEIAYGYNSITNTSYLIPSKGRYQNDKNCNSSTGVGADGGPGSIIDYNNNPNQYDKFCNWNNDQVDGDQIDGDGAFDLYEWSQKMIARPAKDSPEAYCLFSQNGIKVPSIKGVTAGSEFKYLDSLNKAKWHWGQFINAPKYHESFIDNTKYVYAATATSVPAVKYFHHFNYFQSFMFAPLVKSTGRFCKTVQLPQNILNLGFKTDLDGGRKLDESFVGLTNPSFNNMSFNSPLYRDRYLYEATKLVSNNKNSQAAIVLDFDDDFINSKPSAEWVLKIALSSTKEFCDSNEQYSNASFILRYRNSSGSLIDKKITVDGDEVDLCETKNYVFPEWSSESPRALLDLNETNAVIPKMLTVTVPFHSLGKQSFDPSKKIMVYNNQKFNRLNDNLVILQDQDSKINFNILSVRLIDRSFRD